MTRLQNTKMFLNQTEQKTAKKYLLWSGGKIKSKKKKGEDPNAEKHTGGRIEEQKVSFNN